MVTISLREMGAASEVEAVAAAHRNVEIRTKFLARMMLRFGRRTYPIHAGLPCVILPECGGYRSSTVSVSLGIYRAPLSITH